MTSDDGNYRPGTRIVFADANATVSDRVVGTRTGVVNGTPITDDDGVVLYLPVFAARDDGREATTIYVATANVLGETR
jgi:hypothetical protein